MTFRTPLVLALALVVTLVGGSVASAQDAPVVVIDTSMGVITVELNPTAAPITVENFLQYVDDRHYDGTIFHRVIDGFMIQGGEGRRLGKSTRDQIKNEAENGLTNAKYTLAMARTAAVDSATDQFFINVNDNAFLNNGVRDFGYDVFGKVTAGMDVVDAIAVTPVANNVPNTPVVMNSVRRQ